MRTPIPLLKALAALLLTVTPAAGNLEPIDWWRLVKVIDERTLTLRCENGREKGRTLTIKLACVGKAKDNREAVAYMERRLHDHRVTFWHLETGAAKWEAEPMCVILDMDLPGKAGEAVYDFPLLNEELLAWERAPFEDVRVTSDRYGLKARLVQAKARAEERQKTRQKRMSEIMRQK